MRRPRGLRYFFTPPPRGLLADPARCGICRSGSPRPGCNRDDAQPQLDGQFAQRAFVAGAVVEVVFGLQRLVARQAVRAPARCASATCVASKLEQPIARILPAFDQPLVRAPASPRAACRHRACATGRGRCVSTCRRRSESSTACSIQRLPRPLWPAPMSEPTLVSSTTWSRRDGFAASQRPMIVSGFAAPVAGHPARVDVGGVDGVEAARRRTRRAG